MTEEWKDLLERLDTELKEITTKGSNVDYEFSNFDEKSTLLTLIQEIGGASKLSENKTGILILSSCIKSYSLGEMSKEEFVTTIMQPSMKTIIAAQMFLDLNSGGRNLFT